MQIQFDGMEEDIRVECGELLDAMEDSLLLIQEEGLNPDSINAIFRAAHTIKGTGGMFEIGYLEQFSHLAENVLDAVRNDQLVLTESIITTLFESRDQLQSLIDYAIETKNPTLSAELQAKNDRLMAVFRSLLDPDAASVSSSTPAAPVAPAATDDSSGHSSWDIVISPKPGSFKAGIEPREFLKFLDFAGTITEITIDSSALPEIEDYDPESCYLRYRIMMEEVENREAISEALELAEDSWDITITPHQEKTPAVEADAQPKSAPSTTPSTTPSINLEATPPPTESSQSAPPKETSSPKKPAASSIIRVDSNKVDSLINQIGEMVIANASVIQQVTEVKNKELMEAVSFVSRMLEEIRESAMKVRMVQIGETFNRFKRIVHDLARELGKEVDFQTVGGETELDKSVIEKIYDPLIHLIRNGLDHGIETPDIRSEHNKPPRGTLLLSAFYEAGNITIQIKDDGKGIDDTIVYNKAVEKGLVPAGAELERQQIYRLIFHPGFSTADKISKVSGRGVGMDVVKRNIEELRGTIDIDSTLGAGSTITIRLPLTLAIIDGLLVRIAQSHYVIPLDMISECIELSGYLKQQISNSRYINLRGKLLPILDMREFFYGEKHDQSRSSGRDNIVVVHNGTEAVGLLIDELFGEFQAVIKPLGKVFHKIQGISGATILGSGEVALILDVPILLRYVNLFFDQEIERKAS